MAARIRLSDPNLYVNLEFVLETPPATVAGDDQEDGAESKAGDEATEQTRAPETQVIASASTKGSSTVFFSFPQNLPKPESGSRVYIQASLDLRYCDLPADLVSDGPFIDLTDFKPDHGLAGKSGKSAAPATTEEEESGDQGVTWDFAFVSDQPVNVTDDDSQAEKFGQLMASWEQQQPGRALLVSSVCFNNAVPLLLSSCPWGNLSSNCASIELTFGAIMRRQCTREHRSWARTT